MLRPVTKVTAAAAAFAVLLGGSPAARDRQVLVIRSADVTARADEDTTTGQYYTATLPLPVDLAPSDLDRAILDVYVDVRARPRGDFMNQMPILEVCALRTSYAGDVRPEDLDLDTRAVRPVSVGRNRHVKIDITRIVRSRLHDGRNYGLVLGSLTGMREGDFTVVSGRFSGSTVAQVVVYRTMSRR